MKKITSIICIVILCLALFAGCTGSARPNVSPLVTNSPAVNNTPDMDPLESDYLNDDTLDDDILDDDHIDDNGVLPDESPVVGDEVSPNP